MKIKYISETILVDIDSVINSGDLSYKEEVVSIVQERTLYLSGLLSEQYSVVVIFSLISLVVSIALADLKRKSKLFLGFIIFFFLLMCWLLAPVY